MMVGYSKCGRGGSFDRVGVSVGGGRLDGVRDGGGMFVVGGVCMVFMWCGGRGGSAGGGGV